MVQGDTRAPRTPRSRVVGQDADPTDTFFGACFRTVATTSGATASRDMATVVLSMGLVCPTRSSSPIRAHHDRKRGRIFDRAVTSPNRRGAGFTGRRASSSASPWRRDRWSPPRTPSTRAFWTSRTAAAPSPRGPWQSDGRDGRLQLLTATTEWQRVIVWGCQLRAPRMRARPSRCGSKSSAAASGIAVRDPVLEIFGTIQSGRAWQIPHDYQQGRRRSGARPLRTARNPRPRYRARRPVGPRATSRWQIARPVDLSDEAARRRGCST